MLLYHNRDIIFEQSAPNVIQFGHVCENPTEWEQRFEQKDFGTNRHSGKVIRYFLKTS